VFDLYTIFEISRNFNAVLDYHLLLDTFIFTCLGQVGLLKGAIFLRRELDSKEFHMAKAKGSGDLPSADQSFQDDSRLVNYLKRLNRPVMTGELLSDFASPEETAILGNFQHGVVVPLIYKTHLAGLFLLADKMTGRDFTPDDIEFLSALGNQISVAIENARLYEAEKTAIQQLRAAQYQLVQTERLAALGEMSAKIAHEVNNPLGIIKNYVFLLKRETAENGKINEYAEIVGQEIDRIADIVGQLREFQRPVHMKMEAVDVCAVLEDTLKLMERQLTSSKISVQLDNTAERTVVMGRASALKQVFLNLTINARSAMEGGGTLTVTVQNRQEKLVIQVCDTGDGIAADVVPRIFDPFFTTKGDQGSGLGLSVCFGIMKSHAGSITYKDCNTGGCFELLLPLTRNEQKSDK
ncbi:MAG: hypothetical protein DRP45_05265, partial [Candidatus Zixiibacteriota bacterium]